MEYMVKEIARLTGATVKTLHHYDRIGLLKPCRVSDTGYRLYGMKELERLQQILYYRELDFSLKDIKMALENESSRLDCLTKQYELLLARRQRMDCLLSTLEETISLSRKGEVMDAAKLFKGLNKEEWIEALSEQNDHLKSKYGYDMLQSNEIDAEKMNEDAAEAKQFMNFAASALKSGWKASDEKMLEAIEKHLEYLNRKGMKIDVKAFAAQTKFFIEDDFHRNMLEGQQLGLSYYLCKAAEEFASIK